jgi:hypothetical protein
MYSIFSSFLASTAKKIVSELYIASVQIISPKLIESSTILIHKTFNVLLAKAILAAFFTVCFLLAFFEILRQLSSPAPFAGSVFIWGNLLLCIISVIGFFLLNPKEQIILEEAKPVSNETHNLPSAQPSFFETIAHELKVEREIFSQHSNKSP